MPTAGWRTYPATINALRKSGLAWPEIALYPLRRRMRSPNHLVRLKNGWTVSAPPGEPVVEILREIWGEGCYAPRSPLAGELSGDIVVDVGAHVGLFTLWARARWSSVPIVCVEPSRVAYSHLKKNLADNRLCNVTAYEVGCAGRSGTATLNERGHEGVNTMYSCDNYESRFAPKQSIAVWSLDDLFDKANIKSCGLLKLDCEGAEYEILLRASPSTLSKIRNISMEYHVGLNAHEPAELTNVLEHNGFRTSTLPLCDEEGGYMYAWRE